MTLTLPELKYAYDAVEPFFDKETMEIHYSRHHATYVANANNIIANHADLNDKDVNYFLDNFHETLVTLGDSATGFRNNFGGHINHTFFWETLKKDVAVPEALKAKLAEVFGSFEQFKETFKAAALSRFGSGWAWLVLTPCGRIAVVSTANQDNPLFGKDLVGAAGTPLLGLDVWEHAYYLKYQNKRPDYVDAFFSVVDWNKVAERLEAAENF